MTSALKGLRASTCLLRASISNSARSTKLQRVNEIPSAPARYVSEGAGRLEPPADLWTPHEDFQTGNTGNANALGALGAELAGGLKRLAESRRLQVDHVEAVVQGELNDALVAIRVIGAKGHPGIEHIHVKVYVSSGESEIELDRLWQEVLGTSPLLRTFQTSTRVEVQLQVTL